MSNNYNISPAWAGFRKLWIIVAIILFLILLLMLLAGYSPWGKKCDVTPKVVEKTIEKEVTVDNPALLSKISMLEKENASFKSLQIDFDKLKNENAQIASLKADVAELTKNRGLVAGLKAKINALEAVDINFKNPAMQSRINLLEAENASIGDMKKRIMELESANASSNDERNLVLTKRVNELEAENGLISGLKAKVAALEAIDINFIKPQDNTELLQKINNLEIQSYKIPTLESRISELKAENSMIPGLKAKLSALEAVDINFIKPQDNTELLQKMNNLEIQSYKIPTLESRISELKAENSMIPGLKAKIKALEAIDINFIKSESSTPSSPVMAIPQLAKLYFDSGSSRFPTDAGQSMADVIVYLRSNPSSRVTLSGFHDASGNADWNRRLSLRRSNRVKQILLDAGVSASRIDVMRPAVTLGSGSPEEARRVEVKVSN